LNGLNESADNNQESSANGATSYDAYKLFTFDLPSKKPIKKKTEQREQDR
jgi:hypothetical protein